jgi:hypothetical protein
MQQIEIRINGQIDRDGSDWMRSMAVIDTAQGETIMMVRSGTMPRRTACWPGLLTSSFNPTR